MTLDNVPQIFEETLLNRVSEDRDTGTIPVDYVAVRITTDDSSLCYDIFKGMCCVIAEELSCSGVKHFHAVVVGHECFEVPCKRLQRAKLGRSKYWRKKNYLANFLNSISYTVKCGDYKTHKGFHVWIDMAPPWVTKAEFDRLRPEPDSLIAKDGKDLDTLWV